MNLFEALSPGAARAVSKFGGRAPCATCGFSLPKYPGRYPSKCPQCETPIKVHTANNDDTSDA